MDAERSKIMIQTIKKDDLNKLIKKLEEVHNIKLNKVIYTNDKKLYDKVSILPFMSKGSIVLTDMVSETIVVDKGMFENYPMPYLKYGECYGL